MRDKEFRQRGQSIVLVAAAMVMLVLFVALSVDASNAYYHRRTAQNGADGGALGGVRQLATQINNKKKLDGLIQAEMNDFAERNGILDTDGTLANQVNTNVEGWYTDMEGNRLLDEPRVGSGIVPAGAYGVEVITHIVAPTYFGGIFGLRGLPITARAVALVRELCGASCVVPITTNAHALCPSYREDTGECKSSINPRIGKCFNIWNESQTDNPGGFGWINWTWQEAVCADGSRPCPSLDQGVNACDTPTLDANLDPRNCASGFIEVGDWVSNATGVMNSSDHVLCWLRYYVGSRDVNCAEVFPLTPHPFVIPLYGETNASFSSGECNAVDPDTPDDLSTGGLHYEVVGFAQMQLIGFRLSQGGSLVVSEGADGIDPVTGQPCETLTFGEDPNNGFRITARFLEWVEDFDNSNACYDPLGTLLSSPRLHE